jgi:acetate kinase
MLAFANAVPIPRFPGPPMTRGSLVLVVNCGSSSVKASLIAEDGSHALDLAVTGLGHAPRLRADGMEREVQAADPAAALAHVLDEVESRPQLRQRLIAVGHRVAHGGDRYTTPVRLDAETEAGIEALIPLAPLHNPAALAGIRAARARLPELPHAAVFDTAFHSTLPRRSRDYALPRELASSLGIRRYGFHGTSHAYVANCAARYLRTDLERLRLVTCHLGSGASVCAIEYGRSIDTSMGLTPLEGLVMATRPGDLDAGAVLALLRSGRSVDEVDRLLNRESGLLGLTGTPDMREVEHRAADGDDACRVALAIYAHRVRKYVGAYAAVMGGVDAIVFTGGVGQNSAGVRHRIAQRLEFLGAALDEDANRDARVDHERRVVDISESYARCRLLVVATDEEQAIATDTRRLVAGGYDVATAPRIPIAISARHVHLTPSSVETLFGPGATLTPLKAISQPGQYAARETVTLVGPRGRIPNVRVLGPPRAADQVEISRTDEFALGIDAPVRESGDIENTPGIRIEGPAGAITLKSGVICALRHIHMRPPEAEVFGVTNGDRVDVRVDSDGRDLVFGDVLVRVRDDFVLEMHVDTDEGNAAGLNPGATGALEVGELERTAGEARLVRKR